MGFGAVEAVTEGALAVAPEPAHTAASSASSDALRDAVSAALTAAGHITASELLGAGKWTLDGAGLRIEVFGIGKKMLGLTVNAQAEKIIRQEVQRLGGPARFTVTTGEGSAPAAHRAPRPAGGARAAALKHPLVQQAMDLFKADVRSVLDLGQK